MPPTPSSSETLVVRGFPVCLAEDLAVLVSGSTLGSDAGGGGEGEGRLELEKDRGEVGGEKAKGDTEHSGVGIDLLH